MSVIEIKNLTKQYGDVTAVDDVSLSVDSGEVFGFLGPNGAGKSTTINTMLDFTAPTSGSVRVFGHDVHDGTTAVRQRTGLLLEGYGVYPRLTGREHVAHAIATKATDDDPDALLSRVGMVEAADRRAGTYSKGMRQRMAIAVALVGAPELLVFDEPTTGLDPNGARALREIVSTEADRGATVFFSSHILEQVEAVADRVGILLDGELVADDRIEELRADIGGDTTVELDVQTASEELLGRLSALDGVYEVASQNTTVSVVCEDTGETKLDVLTTTAELGLYNDFAVRKTALSDVFSRYTEDCQ